MSKDIKVPDIGDFKDVPVIEIFVKVGDTVKAEDPLCSLESDKATMDVPAPQGGVVEASLEGHDGPVIASTDYMRNYADQVREYIQLAGRRYVVLGTDGFGRSDYRVKLRRFFEVDRHYVVVAALKALADDGAIKPAVVAEAITKYGLDTERAAPWTV